MVVKSVKLVRMLPPARAIDDYRLQSTGTAGRALR
jgi:hypothetical protein